MIVMRPVDESQVVESLNQGRFEGDVRAYVVMDGPQYHGYMLYRVDGEVTAVLECGVEEQPLIDGAVRACIAAGENAGAARFTLNSRDERLENWRQVFLKGQALPAPNEQIFHSCCG